MVKIKMKISKKQKMILFVLILSGIYSCSKSSNADPQIKDKTNSNLIEYIYYHENNPLESDLTVKVQRSGKVSSVIKKLKPFAKNPQSLSSWEKYEKTIFIDEKFFCELIELFNKIEYDKNKDIPPYPGQSVVDIKIFFNDSKCKNFIFNLGNEPESFKLFRKKLYEAVN
ncbi:MAG: hypothetical protein RBR08_01400 [Desulforegulaceae bacterium]|nr:hypothetical protein [Desulforegulaceae bacterium]